MRRQTLLNSLAWSCLVLLLALYGNCGDASAEDRAPAVRSLLPEVSQPPRAPAPRKTSGKVCDCPLTGVCTCGPDCDCGAVLASNTSTSTEPQEMRAPPVKTRDKNPDRVPAKDGGPDWLWDYYRGHWYRDPSHPSQKEGAFSQQAQTGPTPGQWYGSGVPGNVYDAWAGAPVMVCGPNGCSTSYSGFAYGSSPAYGGFTSYGSFGNGGGACAGGSCGGDSGGGRGRGLFGRRR